MLPSSPLSISYLYLSISLFSVSNEKIFLDGIASGSQNYDKGMHCPISPLTFDEEKNVLKVIN